VVLEANDDQSGPQPAPEPAPFGALAELARVDGSVDPIVLGGPLQYTIEELAEQAGTSVEVIRDFARWLGRPSRSLDEVRYTDADAKAIAHALAFAEAEHLDADALGSLIRGVSSAMERLALRQVEAIVQALAKSEDISDTAARLKAAEYAPARAAMISPIIEHIYRRQYSHAVHRLTTDAIAQRGLHGDDEDFPLLRAVGFADLVDFTARTEKQTAAEFADLVHQFSDTCWDIVNDRGGRIINFIGDAVFFVADDIQSGAEIALGLAAPGALGSCGSARVGLVWARVLTAYGDVFGPGVNLAARIAAAAAPTEVFIGPRAANLLERYEEYSVVPQPEIQAHGIGLVAPARLRYVDDPRN